MLSAKLTYEFVKIVKLAHLPSLLIIIDNFRYSTLRISKSLILT